MSTENMSPEEVASDLEGVYTVRTCRLAGVEMNPLMGFAHLCALSVFPDFIFQTPSQRDDVVVAFSAELESKIIEGTTTRQVNEEIFSYR